MGPSGAREADKAKPDEDTGVVHVDRTSAGNGADEQSPLLAGKLAGLRIGGTGGMQSGVFNLSNTMIGAGIMALPAAIRVLGIAGGTLALVLVALLTRASIVSMLRCMEASRKYSYSELVSNALGAVGCSCLRCCIIINNLGLLMVYLIILGDVLCGSRDGVHIGLLPEWTGDAHWAQHRKLVTCLITAAFLLPLACLRRLDSLRYASQVSVGLALLFVGTTVYLAAEKMSHEGVPRPQMGPTEKVGILTLFSILPVVTNAFICQFNVFPIYRELRRPSIHKMTSVVDLAISLVCFVYIVTSVSAFVLFGESTSTDVLQNFDASLAEVSQSGPCLAGAIRLGYCASLILTSPLLLFALRNVLDAMLFNNRSTWQFGPMTVSILAIAVAGSVAIPDIWVALQFTGATAAVMIGFIFPGLVVLKTENAAQSRGETNVAYVLVIVGVVMGVMGVSADFLEQMKGKV